MKNLTFRGGLHMYDGKELTMDKPIEILLPKGDLVFPLQQHIGALAKPVVSVGDSVKMGQLIAESAGFISANIHSSVSGKVKAIEPRMTVGGNKVNSIIIENDGEYSSVEYIQKDINTITKEEIRERVKMGGIVGLGGAGFPAHVKITPKNESAIEYIIINCAECEPYLTSDYRQILEASDRLIGGAKVLLKLFDNAKVYLGIEDNKPKAIEKLMELTKNESKMEVKVLKTKYPQGAERQLIYATTKRKVNSSMLPADAGCVVQNVESVVTIYSAAILGKPLIRKVITVTGDAVKNPVNFKVKVGTNYRELLEAAGGFISEPSKIISGGPMMGVSLFTLDLPVTKTSSALLCLKEDPVSMGKVTNCIRCGKCVNYCPANLVPSILADLANRNKEDEFVKASGMECCECGTCSYICPAKRSLTQSIRATRRNILANKKK